LQGGVVHKHTQTALQEAAVLQLLLARGVRVPRVLDCHENLLVLEHLPGEPLPDLIEHGGYDPKKLSDALHDWFADFHVACPGKSRGDVNGRNFLYDGHLVYGIDFEEALQPGTHAQDAGRLAAFLATYHTQHPQKQTALLHTFLHDDMQPAFLQELNEIKKRRPPA